MSKYNLSDIMAHAWRIFRKAAGLAFSECLHRAWAAAKAAPMNADTIRKAAEAAGVSSEVNTWAGWRRLGFEVVHGSKALFQAVLIYASKGTRPASLTGHRPSLWPWKGVLHDDQPQRLGPHGLHHGGSHQLRRMGGDPEQ